MSALKNRWLNYVKTQTEKTARDAYAKPKLMGWVVVLMIVWYNIPKAASSIIGCAPCVNWAATFCIPIVTAGGACAAVAAFPPLLCGCLISAGGLACAGAAGTCIAVCLAPTP